MKSEKFLQFNEQSIYFQNFDGQFWIAIKPICEALNIDYYRSFKNVKNDPILGPALSNQTIQVFKSGIFQGRKMTCIPEKYIYGWIFSLKSESLELIQYKKECYNLLYNYFHGTITKRKEFLKERLDITSEISQLEQSIKNNPEFLKLQELKKKNTEIGKKLKNNDDAVSEELKDLFNYENT